ncbi:hypothetical protein L227DRAFT_310129 [Lentinus tigrinus ALCF2SS1-6]|uniref:Uncharacterized protein n=1 Tax=Lentinus tigrinus ALCF2SS1-6 TaxID=1328759 RepID=A0A5C2RUL6_9APHY|nr:hypothetical protein L227DRAFT_310129 [Lentinus tigrinus ALCF2SS1-6]
MRRAKRAQRQGAGTFLASSGCRASKIVRGTHKCDNCLFGVLCAHDCPKGCRLCTVQCFADARAPLFLFQHSRSGGEKEAFTQLHRFTGTADLRTCGSYESRVGLFRRLASTEGQG